jgi:hypothetical protein
VNHPRILGIGTANPPVRLIQEQSFDAAGYKGERVLKIFLNSDIDYRHFYHPLKKVGKVSFASASMIVK